MRRDSGTAGYEEVNLVSIEAFTNGRVLNFSHHHVTIDQTQTIHVANGRRRMRATAEQTILPK